MSSGLWTLILAFIIIGMLTAWGLHKQKEISKKGKDIRQVRFYFL